MPLEITPLLRPGQTIPFSPAQARVINKQLGVSIIPEAEILAAIKSGKTSLGQINVQRPPDETGNTHQLTIKGDDGTRWTAQFSWYTCHVVSTYSPTGSFFCNDFSFNNLFILGAAFCGVGIQMVYPDANQRAAIDSFQRTFQSAA